MTESAVTPRLLTVAEAMEALGIKSKDKIYELMRGGELAYVSLPPHTQQAGRRVELAEIEAFIARNRNGGAS